MRSSGRAMILSFSIVLACGGGEGGDGGTDAASRDAGRDAGGAIRDAGFDAGTDAGPLPSCGTASPLALSQCVEPARYQADLELVAMERVPESAHWMQVQDLCADRLTSLGFTVERHAYATGVNVVGTRLGESEPDRQVLVGAHYDHIAGCDGADDNASGVAGALEVARVLSGRSFPRTLVVACWDEEERGLIGSSAWAARARAGGQTIDAYFNFEMIGYSDDTPESQTIPPGLDLLFRDAVRELSRNERRGNFVAAVSNESFATSLASLETYADRIGLPFIALEVPDSVIDTVLAGDLRRSDHASFWDQSYPAAMLTDTANFRYDRYHCTAGPDVPANLDREFASQVVRITVAAAAEGLGLAR